MPRGDFDRLLLSLAQRSGAILLRDRVGCVEITDNAAIQLRSGLHVRARFAIDASGRAGILARSCGFPALDSYTTGYIRRSWRWPEGERRSFTQSVTFRLR